MSRGRNTKIPLAPACKLKSRDVDSEQLEVVSYIGGGSFHHVYKVKVLVDIESIKAEEGDIVFRENICSSIDNPVERSARIYKELNINAIVFRCWINSEYREGLLIPFYDAHRVNYWEDLPYYGDNDVKLASAILNVYKETRRVVIDALVPGNFIFPGDGGSVLIDPEQAVRRGSVVSDVLYYRPSLSPNHNGLTPYVHHMQNQMRDARSKGYYNTYMMLDVLDYIERRMINYLEYNEHIPTKAIRETRGVISYLKEKKYRERLSFYLFELISVVINSFSRYSFSLIPNILELFFFACHNSTFFRRDGYEKYQVILRLIKEARVPSNLSEQYVKQRVANKLYQFVCDDIFYYLFRKHRDISTRLFNRNRATRTWKQIQTLHIGVQW